LTNITWHGGHLSRDERWAALGHPGVTVWLTGLSGSGKSTIAVAAEAELLGAGRSAYVLDGDNLRHGLNAGLGFSAADRDENVRRVGEVALLMADSGTVALVSLVSPFRAGRDRARRAHDEAGVAFLEVFVDTPLEECRRRDPKGLYAKAAAGEIKGFTGIDSPYEAPMNPDLRIATSEVALDEAVRQVLGLIPD
jgi:adenylyl-sulfate kinase